MSVFDTRVSFRVHRGPKGDRIVGGRGRVTRATTAARA
jgi:hypothetical protein